MIKGCALLVLIVFMFIFAGCETTKGAACGFAKDSRNGWNNLKETDQWMRDCSLVQVPARGLPQFERHDHSPFPDW